MRLALLLAASFALLGLACDAEPEAEREVISIPVDERALLVGEVREQAVAAGSPYVYLRVELAGGERRWIALPLEQRERVRVGARIRVRSLGGRSHVWVDALAREFDWLEYGAPLDFDAHEAD